MTETFRPYVKGRLLHRDVDDDEGYFEDSEDEWIAADDAEESDSTIREFQLTPDETPVAVEDADEHEDE